MARNASQQDLTVAPNISHQGSRDLRPTATGTELRQSHKSLTKDGKQVARKPSSVFLTVRSTAWATALPPGVCPWNGLLFFPPYFKAHFPSRPSSKSVSESFFFLRSCYAAWDGLKLRGSSASLASASLGAGTTGL